MDMKGTLRTFTGAATAGSILAHGTLALATSFALGANPTPLHAQATPGTGANVVEIIAEDYAFSAPDAIPSGWATLRFRNEGMEPHFVLVTRLPEGITIDDYETDLSAEFNRVWYRIRDEGVSEEEALEDLFASLPEWFAGIEFLGGTGLTAAGRDTETVLNLDPGNYVLECYVKTEEGELHYMEGMIRPLTVTGTPSAARPPEADLRVTLRNFEMTVEGETVPGRHVVEVHIEENPEEGFGHNVHVARIEPGAEADEVVEWMNSFDVNGMRSPAPVTFIGGVQIMPAGRTAYFIVDLEPGRHLFVSEYTGHLGVLKEINVAPR
jgi:hypothetical protein